MSKFFSGRILRIDNEDVNYIAKIRFDEYHRCEISISDVSIDIMRNCDSGKINLLLCKLDNMKYLSVYNALITQRESKTESIDDDGFHGYFVMTVLSSTAIIGKKPLSLDYRFEKLYFEITDGYELLGMCPMDLNKSFSQAHTPTEIDIPVSIKRTSVDVIIGKISFLSRPCYEFSKDSLTLSFRHNITFCPKEALLVTDLHPILQKIIDFFVLISGELVTINKLTLVEDNEEGFPEKYEFYGFCNFIKNGLRSLQNTGIDTTAYKRRSIFKLTDFADPQTTLNYWLNQYDNIFTSFQCYTRILLDEDMNIMTINKFLAAMQMIEGYSQAYTDNAEEIAAFNLKKEQIKDQLQDIDDKEFVDNALMLPGVKFRKALTSFLIEGIAPFKDLSKTQFNKCYCHFIDGIVEDRNHYTHSSKITSPRLSMNDIIDITSLCVAFYRICLMHKMGLPNETITYRFKCNRQFDYCLQRLMNIQITIQQALGGFDAEMNFFSDSKTEKQ